jgi:translation initiation factor 2 alpha subunit (eIF-2alpha)
MYSVLFLTIKVIKVNEGRKKVDVSATGSKNFSNSMSIQQWTAIEYGHVLI